MLYAGSGLSPSSDDVGTSATNGAKGYRHGSHIVDLITEMSERSGNPTCNPPSTAYVYRTVRLRPVAVR